MPLRLNASEGVRAIDRQGRLSLPAQVLKALSAAPGDLVAFEVDGKAVRIRKVKISVE